MLWLMVLTGCSREVDDPACRCRWKEPFEVVQNGEVGVPEFTDANGGWMRIEPFAGSLVSPQRLAERRVPAIARPDPDLQATGVPESVVLGGLVGARVQAVVHEPGSEPEIVRVTAVQGRVWTWIVEERAPVDRWASWREVMDPMVGSLRFDARQAPQVTPAVLPDRGVVIGEPIVFAYGEGCSGALPPGFSYDPALDAWVRPAADAPVVVALAPRVDAAYVGNDDAYDRGTSAFVAADLAVVVPCLSGFGPEVVAHAERAVGGAAAATGGDPQRVYIYGDGPAVPLAAVVGARSTAHRAVVLAGGAPWLGRVTVDGAEVQASEVARRPMLWLRPDRGEASTVAGSGRLHAVTIPRDDGSAGLRPVLSDLAERMRTDVGPMVALDPGPEALFEAGVAYLALATPALDARVAPWLDTVIAVGLHGRSAILEEGVVVFDDVPPFVVHASISTKLDAALEAKRAAEATWPAVTDPDRLAFAFDALSALGWSTYEGTSSCEGCVPAEVTDSTPEGSSFVYYEWGTARSVLDGEPLQLAYGTLGGEPTAEQGQAIVRALGDAGLASSWGGDPQFRVPVTMTWQRRTPPEPDAAPWQGQFR